MHTGRTITKSLETYTREGHAPMHAREVPVLLPYNTHAHTPMHVALQPTHLCMSLFSRASPLNPRPLQRSQQMCFSQALRAVTATYWTWGETVGTLLVSQKHESPKPVAGVHSGPKLANFRQLHHDWPDSQQVSTKAENREVGKPHTAVVRSAMKKQGFILHAEELAPNDIQWVSNKRQLPTAVSAVLMS